MSTSEEKKQEQPQQEQPQKVERAWWSLDAEKTADLKTHNEQHERLALFVVDDGSDSKRGMLVFGDKLRHQMTPPKITEFLTKVTQDEMKAVVAIVTRYIQGQPLAPAISEQVHGFYVKFFVELKKAGVDVGEIANIEMEPEDWEVAEEQEKKAKADADAAAAAAAAADNGGAAAAEQ
eukprot:TRINITY_DN66275_c4_g1_i1.p2 TRINITY_DN66275_c4_g1~~TRINITY_DN66275_c4_g1_i1.p2  ORF type:complete len:187 (-),score=121.89 TRINITY_DN66275_c4_g1_i1:61-594(-)